MSEDPIEAARDRQRRRAYARHVWNTWPAKIRSPHWPGEPDEECEAEWARCVEEWRQSLPDMDGAMLFNTAHPVSGTFSNTIANPSPPDRATVKSSLERLRRELAEPDGEK